MLVELALFSDSEITRINGALNSFVLHFQHQTYCCLLFNIGYG